MSLYFLPPQHSIVTVSPHVLANLGHSHLLTEVAFGIEFVGIADDFFLEALGAVVALGDREFLAEYLLHADAATGMALRYQRMLGIAFAAQQFGAQEAVFDILMFAHTMDTRCVAEDDTDIVQHGCFGYKLAIDQSFGFPLRMGIQNLQGTIAYLLAVDEQYLAQFGLLGVVFINDFVNHSVPILRPYVSFRATATPLR